MRDMRPVRQGDVTLLPVNSIPQGAAKTGEHKEYTVAHGEETGHHHTLYGLGADAVVSYEYDEARFLKINEELKMKHQEHSEIYVPDGTYQIIIEKEFDYYEKSIRIVKD